MSTNYHTPIAVGAPANAFTFNLPMSQLDDQITQNASALVGVVGGANALDTILKEWTAGGCYQATSVTRDGDGVVTTATIVWADGSGGVFSTTTKNSEWNAVDAYTITHVDSGKVITQVAVTRDSDGNVITKPALVVST